MTDQRGTRLCPIPGVTLLILRELPHQRLEVDRLIVKPQIQEEQCGFGAGCGLDQLDPLSVHGSLPSHMVSVDLEALGCGFCGGRSGSMGFLC